MPFRKGRWGGGAFGKFEHSSITASFHVNRCTALCPLEGAICCFLFPLIALPLQYLNCLRTGWFVSCWAPSMSTFTAFTSSLMLCPCWTCCFRWPMHAPSQTMVRMSPCCTWISLQPSCVRWCFVHRRPHTADVTHVSYMNAHQAGSPVGLISFFAMVSGRTSLVGHVGGECRPSAVWKSIPIDMCWVPAPFYHSQLVLRLPCYISVRWYAVFTETNLSSRGASWL